MRKHVGSLIKYVTRDAALFDNNLPRHPFVTLELWIWPRHAIVCTLSVCQFAPRVTLNPGTGQVAYAFSM